MKNYSAKVKIVIHVHVLHKLGDDSAMMLKH